MKQWSIRFLFRFVFDTLIFFSVAFEKVKHLKHLIEWTWRDFGKGEAVRLFFSFFFLLFKLIGEVHGSRWSIGLVESAKSCKND